MRHGKSAAHKLNIQVNIHIGDGWERGDDDDEWENEDDDDCGDDDDGGNALFGDWNIDLSQLNLKNLGKMVSWDFTDHSLLVKFGKNYSFEVDGHDFAATLVGKTPRVTGGVIESFAFNGPGGSDFSITDMNVSAKLLAKSLLGLDFKGVLNLLTGGNETFNGSEYRDLLFGGKGDDTLLGNGGDDRLLGGIGNDRLVGGEGENVLIGGVGSDTFVFGPNGSEDIVVDFGKGDKLDFTAFGFTSFEDFASHAEIEMEHGGIQIELDGAEIELRGVHWWNLTPDVILL